MQRDENANKKWCVYIGAKLSKGFSNPDPRIFCYFTCDTLVHAGTLAHPLSPVRETISDAVRDALEKPSEMPLEKPSELPSEVPREKPAVYFARRVTVRCGAPRRVTVRGRARVT